MKGLSTATADPTDMCLPPALLTAPEAAAICRVAPRTWRTWHATGKVPEPIRIGRTPLWRPEELRAWIDAGCPDREAWTLMRG